MRGDEGSGDTGKETVVVKFRELISSELSVVVEP